MRFFSLLLGLLLALPAAADNPKVELDRELIDHSLTVGKQFLLAQQRPEGNFNDNYDWLADSYDGDTNQVRQMISLWGLALLYQDAPGAELAAALERGITFLIRHSPRAENGARYVIYPEASFGYTGSVALAALTLIDTLRALDPAADGYADNKQLLDSYIGALAELYRYGVWFKGYHIKDHSPDGTDLAYHSGAALLALVKAAKYLGYRQLWPAVQEAADVGRRRYIDQALAADPRSQVSNHYFVWAMSAYFELAESGREDAGLWSQRALELADWMIDGYRVLEHGGNNAPSYQGIVYAYELARRAGDGARAEKYRRAALAGLQRLSRWQVGSRLQNHFIRSKAPHSPLALGGVQMAPRQPMLRVDVTQRQLHALLVARRYLFGSD